MANHPTADGQDASQIEPAQWKLAVLILLTLLLGTLVWLHVDGINGPSYWRWPWRVNHGLVPYLMLFVAAIPAGLAQWRFSCSWLGIALLMGSLFCLEVANRGMDLPPFDLTRVATIIEEPGTTGYFTHAQEFVQSGQSLRDYLRDYIHKMPGFTLHARNKPPGAILFYVPFLRWAATENGAALGAGYFLGFLATLSVPATYLLAKEITGDRSAAFQAAACMALCPGLLLFLPESDQFYPVYTAALLILWMRALRTGRAVFAIAFGLIFAAICFQTFNLLVLGVFVAGYAAWLMTEQCDRAPSVALTALRQAAIVIAASLAFYAVLWLWCGYNPVSTLITGITNHQQDMPATHRVWPTTVPFDLTDFCLGMGWVCPLLAAFYLVSHPRSPRRGLIWLCLFEPIAVAVSGQLQAETARVWIFIMPLVLVPAGLELARWRPAARMAALGCLWLLMAVLSQNMVFV